MKSLDSQYRLLVVICLIVFTTLSVAIYRPFSYAAYSDCCSPPTVNPMAGRFQQNAQVTVYIPTNSGLTLEEIGAIKVAMEDWNDEDNNSRVQFNVVEQDPPGEQINNTIVVNFIDINNPNTGGWCVDDARPKNYARTGDQDLGYFDFVGQSPNITACINSNSAIAQYCEA